MAMVQTGMGLSRIILLIGAGYGGTIVLRNGRLSEILDELQVMVKGLEKARKDSGSDSDVGDALAMQVRRLAMEVRQLASARPITILNGNRHTGDITSLLVPAAAVGAVGYGYMWWKGLSFSDLMYVTKKNVANAVSSMTKQLDNISVALAAAKRHLTQRIDGVDGKLDEHKVILANLTNEVADARGQIADVGLQVDSLKGMVYNLDGRMESMQERQNFCNAGVMYLCEFAAAQGFKVPAFIQDAPKPKCHYLEYTEVQGLKQIMQTLESGNFGTTQTEANFQKDISSVDSVKSLSRSASIKC